MAHFAVTAVGADRPGIVAAVTKSFVDLGCNLEDTSSTILRGHFAMMLIVDAPGGVAVSDIENALAGPAGKLGLSVTVRPIEDAVAPTSPAGERWTISVYGADKPGIVNQVASLLSDKGINITDLTTRVIGGGGEPVYTMLLDVAIPPGASPDKLEMELQDLSLDLQVECTMHLSDADVL
jgi:glycine cleavage system transcriptional repressor